MATTSSTSTTIEALHIVYVHGFRGDHTSFQAFPSDLHHHLLPSIPTLQTWVYPTYKSAKPLSVARANLLTWLHTLPPGPIILAGHSMGGLLVAETATDSSPTAKRIIGMIGLDAPLLGMHPHVVVSGIASLFPKDEKSKEENKINGTKAEGKTSIPAAGAPAPSAQGMPLETAVNDLDMVNFVSNADAFPKGGQTTPKIDTTSSIHITIPAPRTPSPSLKSATTSTSIETTASNMFSLLDQAKTFFQKNADDPFIRWLNKHSDAPVTAMTRWVIEHFEFGFAQFDYLELVERYNKLEQWDGDWVNYWTITAGEDDEEDKELGTGPPPTPRKTRLRLLNGTQVEPRTSTSSRYESEFERSMRKAVEREHKRQGNEEAQRQKKAMKEEAEKLKKEQKGFMKKELEAERDRARKLEKEEAERKSMETSSTHVSEKGKVSSESLKVPTSAVAVVPKDTPTKSASVKSPPSSRPPTPPADTAHHFITLPGSYLHRQSQKRWLKVRIAGVEDEVGAHCGIFIRGQNLEYDAFVERVGALVRSWVL